MATLTKGKTFTNGETVTPQKLHELVDLGTVSGIVNADIAAGAAISDSKLAQIATAGKVANTATTATSANTANSIVARDAGGSFSAGTITAALSGNAATATTAAACSGNAATATTAAACSGNAATATTLQTARTINGVSFNGSGNITVTAAPNAHAHAISDTTGLQTALDGKQASGSYAAASHTHDDRYYTETEIDTKLSAIPTTSTINSFSAYPTLNQNIANNILTKVLFQETYWNKNSNFQNSRFTPSVSGIYFLTATISSNITGLAGKSYVIQLVKNGSNILQVNTQSTIQGLFQLNGITDYVEVFLFNSSGSLIALTLSPEQTYFQGFFLSQL